MTSEDSLSPEYRGLLHRASYLLSETVPRASSLHVFFRESAYLKMLAEIKRGAQFKVEVCGLLVGTFLPSHSRILIEDCIVNPQATSHQSAASCHLDPEFIEQVARQVTREGKFELIGRWHLHYHLSSLSSVDLHAVYEFMTLSHLHWHPYHVELLAILSPSPLPQPRATLHSSPLTHVSKGLSFPSSPAPSSSPSSPAPSSSLSSAGFPFLFQPEKETIASKWQPVDAQLSSHSSIFLPELKHSYLQLRGFLFLPVLSPNCSRLVDLTEIWFIPVHILPDAVFETLIPWFWDDSRLKTLLAQLGSEAIQKRFPGHNLEVSFHQPPGQFIWSLPQLGLAISFPAMYEPATFVDLKKRFLSLSSPSSSSTSSPSVSPAVKRNSSEFSDLDLFLELLEFRLSSLQESSKDE